jgi:hypothetical protein
VDFDLTPTPVTSTATVRPRLVAGGPGQIET